MPYVDLQRRFIALADDREETLARIEAARALGQGDAGWSDVLDCPRAVVLAEAGAGKTAELQAQRDRLCREGGFALVLPVEGLAGGGVEACCTPDELAAFEAWRAVAPVDGFESVPRGWFFLDAVDEAKLTGKRFSAALSRLAHALGPARDRAHVVITSRVTDWRPGADLEEVARWLPPPRAAADPAADAPVDVFLDDGADAIRRPQPEDAPEPPRGVRVFALAPLRREQVERLAREGAGLADADAFLQALDEADLWDLVSRPLDALDLAQFWRANRRLESRARTLDWIIGKRLSEHNEAHERVPGAPTPANARRLAARLAAALTFARRRTIALPDADPSFAGTESVDPAEVLDEITAAERVRLLSAALFDPASYGRARFHHREVEEFLTAEWLHARLQAGMPHAAVLDFLLPTRAGLRVAPETLRPALAWLGRRDDRIFEAALQHTPAALLRHGDPGSLPLAQRERLLEAYALKAGTEESAGVNATLVARLAKPDLADAIRRLWPPGVASSASRHMLTIAVGRGRISACADLVAGIAVARQAPQISRQLAIYAAAGIGDRECIFQIVAELCAEGAAAPCFVLEAAIQAFSPRFIEFSTCIELLRRLKLASKGSGARIEEIRQFDFPSDISVHDLWRILRELKIIFEKRIFHDSHLFLGQMFDSAFSCKLKIQNTVERSDIDIVAIIVKDPIIFSGSTKQLKAMLLRDHELRPRILNLAYAKILNVQHRRLIVEFIERLSEGEKNSENDVQSSKKLSRILKKLRGSLRNRRDPPRRLPPPVTKWRAAFTRDAAVALQIFEAELVRAGGTKQDELVRRVLMALGYSGKKPRRILASTIFGNELLALSRLVGIVFDFVPPVAVRGLDRRSKFPYSNGEADETRTALLDALAAIPGDDTVAALLALAERFADKPFAHRFRDAAVRRATADAEPGWDARDVVQVEREQDLVPRTGDELFALVVRRLDGIAGDLVDADFSDGPLLALLDRPPGTDEDEWPREREKVVQAWAAKQLRDRARERYGVVREPEVADQKEPDILVTGGNGPSAEVAVEIKIADDWTVRQLEHALLVQLREQYLRPTGRRHGVLLLVHLDPGRTWKDPDGGDATTFAALVAHLAALAGATRANASGAVTLAVAAIDAARFVKKARALKAKAAARQRKASTGEPRG